MAVVLTLLLAAPVFEDFNGPLDPGRWYVGVSGAPKKGALKIPKGGWIVSRGLPDDRIERVEIDFRGALEVTFHEHREPLSSPSGAPILIKRSKEVRTLAIGKTLAVDGVEMSWKGRLLGTFRLAAAGSVVEIHEVRVSPRLREGPGFSRLERDTVHFVTTPPLFRRNKAVYARETLPLWDVEVCILYRRAETAFHLLRAPPRGSPALGVLVAVGDGKALAFKAASNPLAMRDWGDERGNLPKREFESYIAREYAIFEVLLQAQRALNTAVPERKDLQPLVHLAVIRHAKNARAAVALAETQGAKKALKALRQVLGKEDYRRLTGDRIRAGAGAAARKILENKPPPQWKGFQFDPKNRFLTLTRAEDLVR